MTTHQENEAMNRDQRATRLGLVSAVAAAVLYLSSGLVVAKLPDASATGAEVQRYLADHADGLATSGLLAVLATVPLLVFLATLRRRLGLAADWLADTAFGAGLVLIAVASVSIMVRLGLSLHPDELPGSTALALVDVARFYPPVVTGVVLTLAATVALASLRYGALPRWTGMLSGAYAVYEFVEMGTIFGSGGAFEPSGTVNLIGTLGFLVWAIAVGFAVSRPAAGGPASPTVREQKTTAGQGAIQ